MSSLFAPETLFSVLLTLKYSILALIVAWALSWIIVKLNRSFLFTFSRVLWVLPGMGYAMLTLLILRGLQVEDRFSMQSVLMAWVIAGVPYLTLGIREALSDIDPREREALRSLGATPLQVFFRFDFIRTLPSQLSLLTQQFWLYLASFSLVMILNGGPPNETLEVGVFTSIQMGELGSSRAFALAFWQSVILLSVRKLGNAFSPNQKGGGAEWVSREVVKHTAAPAILFASGAAIVLGLWRSGQYLELLLTLFVALMVALIVTLLCLWTFRWRWTRSVLEIGAWVSPMVLSLIVWRMIAFDLHPMVNVILVQTLLFAPWFTRLLYPLMERARTSEMEVARSLGAGPFRSWLLIEWPRLKPTIMKAMALVATLSVGEVSSVLLFSRGEFETVASATQNAFLRFRMNDGFWGTLVIMSLSLLVVEGVQLISQRRARA